MTNKTWEEEFDEVCSTGSALTLGSPSAQAALRVFISNVEQEARENTIKECSKHYRKELHDMFILLHTIFQKKQKAISELLETHDK